VDGAQKDDWCRFDRGYFTRTALAQMAAATASCVGRLNHQTPLLAAVAARWSRVELAARLATGARPSLEPPLVLGAQAPGAARLMAARVPAAVVHARRRTARTNATNTGDTPAHAHLTRLAWNRLITHVPETIWPPTTVLQVSPSRWQLERLLKSWKSALHVASRNTPKETPT